MLVRYRVNQTDFTHPLLAWEAAKQQNTTPELSLGDNFKDYDWFAPLTLSIKSLEDIRVTQITAKGRPIRIVYSGGSDSHTVAIAFARNGIAVKYTLLDYTNLDPKQLDGSAFVQNKLKRLNALHTKYNLPAPEYEVIHVGAEQLEHHFQKGFHLQGAFYGCNQSFSLNQIEANLKYSKWAPQSTTNVYGIEKPRLYIDHIGVYWQITDTMSMYTYSNEYDTTWFFLSEELPDLIKAQCLSVLRVVRSRFPHLELSQALNVFQTDASHYYDWCMSLGRQIEPQWAAMSKQCKTYGSNFENPNDPRYTHLLRYQTDLKKYWNNYQELFQDLKDITGTPRIESILTKRFHFAKV